MEDNRGRLKDNLIKVNGSDNLSAPNPSNVEGSSYKRYMFQGYIFVL